MQAEIAGSSKEGKIRRANAKRQKRRENRATKQTVENKHLPEKRTDINGTEFLPFFTKKHILSNHFPCSPKIEIEGMCVFPFTHKNSSTARNNQNTNIKTQPYPFYASDTTPLNTFTCIRRRYFLVTRRPLERSSRQRTP